MVLFIVATMMFTMMVTLSGSPPKSAMWSWIHSSANNCRLGSDLLDFLSNSLEKRFCQRDLIKKTSIARDLIVREAHETKWTNPADVIVLIISHWSGLC